MASVELRRFIIDPQMDPAIVRLGTIVNRLVNRDNGAASGRIWLVGDDGNKKAPSGSAAIPPGTVLSANNYPLRVEPTSTNQVNVLHSNGATIGLRVQDAGLTTGVPATLTSTLAVTGATTLTGALAANGGTTTTTLTASGATLLNGAVTLGDAAADVITVTGTATVAEILTLAKGLVVDTTTFVVDAVNDKVKIGAVPVSTDAQLSTTGYIASMGATGAPTTSADQVFLFFNTGAGTAVLRAQNPGTATWLPLRLDGLSTTLLASNVARISVDGTGIGFFATAPVAQQTGGAATAGALYTATEQGMLNAAYAAMRAYGLLT